MAYINGKEVLFSSLIVKTGDNGGSDNSYEQGFEDGKKAEYDTFWDTYQDYGNRRIYYMAFSKFWNDETYNPKYPIVIDSSGNTNAYDVFMNSVGITDTKVDIDISQSKATRSMFMNCTNLVTIRKIITSATMTSYDRSFNNCANLENITFEGEIGVNISFVHSSKLSDTSIQNIIDHLADLTGKDTQTLTFHKTVGGKLTDTQKATITSKNWTLAY